MGVIAIQAKWSLGLWIAMNLFDWLVLNSEYVNGVAYAAHVGDGCGAAPALPATQKAGGGVGGGRVSEVEVAALAEPCFRARETLQPEGFFFVCATPGYLGAYRAG